MTKLIGLYPGSFDPITNGHIDIIIRGSRVVDKLVVGVAQNDNKNYLFSMEERKNLIESEIKKFDQSIRKKIKVLKFNGLLMHFAQSINARIIIRGLRAVSDFDYEFQMTGMNARLNANIETIFLMASEKQQFISSRFVKEIFRLDIEQYAQLNWSINDNLQLTNIFDYNSIKDKTYYKFRVGLQYKIKNK